MLVNIARKPIIPKRRAFNFYSHIPQGRGEGEKFSRSSKELALATLTFFLSSPRFLRILHIVQKCCFHFSALYSKCSCHSGWYICPAAHTRCPGRFAHKYNTYIYNILFCSHFNISNIPPFSRAYVNNI